MNKIIAILLLAFSIQAHAEIPASHWVGEWIEGEDMFKLNKDRTCLIKYEGRTIEGVYGIDTIEGYLIVIAKEGKGHIFSAGLFDDRKFKRFESFEKDYEEYVKNRENPNGFLFWGYMFDARYNYKHDAAKASARIFRKKGYNKEESVEYKELKDNK